jgi:hypothetical protein
MSPIGEVPSVSQDDSKVNDSIVTDALLQMTSFSSNPIESEDQTKPSDENNQNNNNNVYKSKEDMDRVIAELTRAVIKSRNVTTLTRAMSHQTNKSSDTGLTGTTTTTGSIRRGGTLRNSLKSLRNSRGIEAMRDLWQQTGMKTNGGRKLLVDSLSEEETEQGGLKEVNQQRKRQYPKRLKRQSGGGGGPCRVHGKLSNSSSSGSEGTSPPYRQVFGTKRTVSLTSSTELYAEVYRTSSGESSRSPM